MRNLSDDSKVLRKNLLVFLYRYGALTAPLLQLATTCTGYEISREHLHKHFVALEKQELIKIVRTSGQASLFYITPAGGRSINLEVSGVHYNRPPSVSTLQYRECLILVELQADALGYKVYRGKIPSPGDKDTLRNTAGYKAFKADYLFLAREKLWKKGDAESKRLLMREYESATTPPQFFRDHYLKKPGFLGFVVVFSRPGQEKAFWEKKFKEYERKKDVFKYAVFHDEPPIKLAKELNAHNFIPILVSKFQERLEAHASPKQWESGYIAEREKEFEAAYVLLKEEYRLQELEKDRVKAEEEAARIKRNQDYNDMIKAREKYQAMPKVQQLVNPDLKKKAGL